LKKINKLIELIEKNGLKNYLISYSNEILNEKFSDEKNLITIDNNSIKKFETSFRNHSFSLSKWNNVSLPTAPEKMNKNNALCYFILLNSLNFCFWKTKDHPKWVYKFNNKLWDGALGLFAFFTDTFNYSNLENSLSYYQNKDQNNSFFQNQNFNSGFLLLANERQNILSKTAEVLLSLNKTSFQILYKAAEKSTDEFIIQILNFFPDYYDPFLKRAQLLAAMLQGYFKEYYTPFLKNIENLTLFADYKVPQTLERLGILNFSKDFCKMLNSNKIFRCSSKYELILRANTILAGEKILDSLNSTEKKCNAAELDYTLWELSQNNSKISSNININIKSPKNYIKVITTYY
jgi:hypothetical protein